MLIHLRHFFTSAHWNFFKRPLPLGIVNWRYLLRRPHAKVRIHRHLWRMARPSRLPLIIFLSIELIIWLRWVFFSGWRSSWRAVQYWGITIRKQEGMSIASQMKKILSLSLGYCIPPVEIYTFGLYRTKSKQEIWNYIFTHELPTFHLWRSASLGANQQSLSLLQDKYELTKLLSAKGIQMAPILGLVSRRASFDPNCYLHYCSRLFCKPRHGSHSRDTFIVEACGTDGKIVIFSVKNGIQAQLSTKEKLQKAMAQDDFIIQPFLYNHPAFTALNSATDAVTLRVITEKNPLQGFICYCATLEVPNNMDTTKYFHIILPIDLYSGRLTHFPDLRLPAPVQACYDALYENMNCFFIPYWKEIRKSALTAHQCCPDVYAIAWDYVITADGPYLLEGNTGWGARTTQMLHGGLLLKNINARD